MITKKQERAILEALEGLPKIHLTKSDYAIPHILDFVKKETWNNIRPEYQRRLVWDIKKKSKFIESLLMNLPIPPIFLYEFDTAAYEVMDGQQRITTICEFFDDQFKLKGLEELDSLNKLSYSDLSEPIQRELLRGRIPAITVERTRGQSQKGEIQREVFNRLNTGGVTLNAQEMRNSNYSGSFNELLLELAAEPAFTNAWGIPSYRYKKDRIAYPEKLREDRLFKRMHDSEIVLRFFALENGGSATKLKMDKLMEKHRHATSTEINAFRNSFKDRLHFAVSVMEDLAFKAREPGRTNAKDWVARKQVYDATMIALKDFLHKREVLIRNRKIVQQKYIENFGNQKFYDTLIAQHSTRANMEESLKLIAAILQEGL